MSDGSLLLYFYKDLFCGYWLGKHFYSFWFVFEHITDATQMLNSILTRISIGLLLASWVALLHSGLVGVSGDIVAGVSGGFVQLFPIITCHHFTRPLLGILSATWTCINAEWSVGRARRVRPGQVPINFLVITGVTNCRPQRPGGPLPPSVMLLMEFSCW